MKLLMFLTLVVGGILGMIFAFAAFTSHQQDAGVMLLIVSTVGMALAYTLAIRETPIETLRRGGRGRAAGRSEGLSEEEGEAMQALMRGLDRMESRIANLETILMERSK